VKLLEAWMDEPRRTARSSRLVGAAIVAGVIGFLVLLVALGVLLARWIAGLF